MGTDKTDEELAIAAQGGDRAAMTHLLLRHEVSLLAHITAKLRGRAESRICADDVLQESLFKACLDIGGFRSAGAGSFKAWLTTVANHRLLDMLDLIDADKRGGNAQFLAGSDGFIFAALAAIPSDGSTPSSAVARLDNAQAVQSALNRLAPDYQAVLQLRFVQGLSVEQTAERMGRGKGAVCMLSHRALEALRETIGAGESHFFSKCK